MVRKYRQAILEILKGSHSLYTSNLQNLVGDYLGLPYPVPRVSIMDECERLYEEGWIIKIKEDRAHKRGRCKILWKLAPEETKFFTQDFIVLDDSVAGDNNESN